ncbi:restriction endonuclease [Maridesulfovibrio sp.]|uniref:restriction endonuclease n=1 Tax=Maridesulfovibrio sp. TaxID=2795000 RepID=UPI0029C9F52F|nr:restriction endonuclease [Maridesulfovibrio sp.]
MNIPKFYELMQPVLTVIEELGGSGTNQEIAEGVILCLNLPDDVVSHPHNPDKSSQTEVEYRLAWARTYLKNYGLLENSEKGVWAFSERYQRGMQIEVNEVLQTVRAKFKKSKKEDANGTPEIVADPESWREELHQTILALDPSAFERLTKRILREVGFVQVEVTGQSGDGGIDGKGIVKMQEVLSYHVVFQCKRYKGSVGAGAIRDFRGAMVGRADKGLFITTGIFTRDAEKEASRDGASPIDLINGESLVNMLKKLRLGVNVRMVEEVEVDSGWFEKI